MPHKKWPGLTNPFENQPIENIRTEWQHRLAAENFWHKLAAWTYRGKRNVGLGWRWFWLELGRSKKRTILELIVGTPILLLAVDPVRDWVDRLEDPAVSIGGSTIAVEYGWIGVGLLAVMGGMLNLWGRSLARQEYQREVIAIAEHGHVVTEAARRHAIEFSKNIPPSSQAMRQTMAVCLQSMADLAVDLLGVPPDVEVHANLMVRMDVIVKGTPDHTEPGYGIVAYSVNRPAAPAWTRLVAGDLGAGEAFETTKVQVIEDTQDPRWCRVFSGLRTRSFVSLPLLMVSERVVAVVNIDADRPMIFTKENSHAVLHRVLAGPLSLMADILYCTRDGALPPRP